MPSPSKRPKIFVGTVEIAGVMRSITNILQTQGYEADLYLFTDHPFGYNSEPDPIPLFSRWREIKQALSACSKTDTDPELDQQLKTELENTEQALLKYFLEEYDVFIFNGWRTILENFTDLPLLREKNKKIIMFLLGSEGRPPWMGGHCLGKPLQYTKKRSQHIDMRVKLFEDYCDCVLSHPPASQFLTKPFLPLLTFGLPLLPPPATLVPSWPARPIIVHAPSSPLKGTARIEEACDQLRAEGYDFEFRTLSNIPNAEVLAHLAECSFVVDELYSDSLLAGLGIEAACFAKPTIVGTLPRLEELMLPEAMPLPPCEAFYGDNPLASMRRLLDDPAYAQNLGQQAKDFITEQWSTEKIGVRLCSILQGELPEKALCNPQDIRYFRGWGMSDAEFHDFVSRYIAKYGHDALCIQDKPQLLLALLRWLNQKPPMDAPTQELP